MQHSASTQNMGHTTPPPPHTHTLKQQVQLYRAITQFSLFQYLKGAWSMRSAWRSFLALPKPHPPHHDAPGTAARGHQHVYHDCRSSPAPTLPADVVNARRFGLGFFLYVFSMVPPAFSFIVRYTSGQAYLSPWGTRQPPPLARD